MTPNYPRPTELLKDLDLGQVILKKGNLFTTLRVNDSWYKLFHHTGWWSVPAEYFESNPAGPGKDGE